MDGCVGLQLGRLQMGGWAGWFGRDGCMNGRMDGWVNFGWMDFRWTDGRKGGWLAKVNEPTNGKMDGRNGAQTNGSLNG